MQWLFDAWVAIRDFMELGGPVLNAIALVILWMWVLILERIIYFRSAHPRAVAAQLLRWREMAEKRPWHSQQIREAMISQLTQAANGSIPMIKTLVALCPLLGLVGTVTGMIDVFDVLALSGTGNARSMAAGVSKATIPTMAGMVGALSGVFAAALLSRAAARATRDLDDKFAAE